MCGEDTNAPVSQEKPVFRGGQGGELVALGKGRGKRMKQ